VRYTTAFNFVGAPIDGYEAAECILTARAARALAAAQAEVERDGLSLKVYDCYRPQAAVNHFARWARTADETMKRAFYPEEPKGSLFARGYIAYRSGHSRGSTVDLTLVALPHTPNTAYPDRADGPLPRCDRPRGERFDERDLDMGTAYDCLSPVAATESGAVGAEARRNRYRLREVMGRHGFRNYPKEWWHFTLREEPYRSTYFDFPVR
jgi:D-alanyl-D-alanine dipeptidase